MISLLTNHPVAINSMDHIEPRGTYEAVNHSQAFNNKLYELYSRDKKLRILDLGCGRGHFVQNCINDRHIGVGLDGSDYNRTHEDPIWLSLPNNLLTCDLTKPFILMENGKPMKFDAITSFDVFEHFKKEDLFQVFLNILNHCHAGTFLVNSIALFKCPPHHETVETKEWWLDRFNKAGFIQIEALSYHHYWPQGGWIGADQGKLQVVHMVQNG